MIFRRIAALALFLTAQAYAQFPFGSSLLKLVVDPSNHDILWAHSSSSTAQVLYRSLDQGKNWRGIPFSNPLGVSIARIQTHPNLGSRLYVLTGSAGGYLWITTDGGTTWKNPSAGWPANLTARQVFVAAAPSQLVYVQIGSQLRRSTDGGVTFDGGIETPCTDSFEGSPSDPRRLACSGNRTMYVSTDEGRTWAQKATVQASSAQCTLVNDFRLPQVYFVTCFAIVDGFQRDLFYRSTDGLQTLPPSAPTNGFPRIYVSPDRSSIISTGVGSSNARSRDLGLTWESLGPSSQDDFGFDATDSSIVYRSGLGRSTDGGRTFTTITPRLYTPLFPTVAPVEITLESGTGYIPNVAARDVDGTLFGVDKFAVTTPPTAPWLQYVPPLFVSATGFAAGTYEASASLALDGATAAQIPVKLQVVPQRDPPIFLRGNRVAGNGVYVSESGTEGPFAGDNGPATAAPLSLGLRYISSDADGNFYLAYQYRVMKVDSSGKIRTWAGNGASGNTGDGRGAAFATFKWIGDILQTDDGLLIVDWLSSTIRLVRSNGFIEAFYTQVGFTGPSLSFDSKLAVDSTGTLYVATSSEVYKWQGNNTWTSVFKHSDVAPSVNGVTAFYKSFAIDRRNNSFVLAYTDRIIRRTAAGQVTVLVGTPGKTGFAGDGNNTPTGSLTESPNYLAIDAQGAVYFTDHSRIRVITQAGVIGTIAGNEVIYSPTAPLPDDNAFATSAGFGSFLGTHVRPNGELLAYNRGFVYRLAVSNGPTSAIDSGGVVTLAGKAKIAPGAIFSIYGKQLADGTVNDPTPPLKNKLGSTSVQVNGADIPLFYVSPTQVNAQMPYNVPLGAANVKVVRNGTATSEQTVQIVAAAPDVIQYGAQRAVAVNENGSVNGLGTPAPTGSYVVLYLTGIGVVTPAITAGQAAPGAPLAQATLPYKVTLSNASTTVDINPLFLGHTPTYAGLVQANFQIPNIPAGDYNLTLTVGGEPSNVTKLAVSAP